MQRLPLRMFSSGMLMRVLFATATAFPADILLLDEWLSVVDENFSAKAEQRLLKLVSQAAIVIIASHDHELLRRTCTSIVNLDHGRIVTHGPARSSFRPTLLNCERSEHEEDTGCQRIARRAEPQARHLSFHARTDPLARRRRTRADARSSKPRAAIVSCAGGSSARLLFPADSRLIELLALYRFLDETDMNEP